MALGPGKYDDALTVARKLCGATCAILIVAKGERGSGFACQSDVETLLRLPSVLRHIADQMEADLKKGKI